ncbi:MAG: hypothetical protein BWX45_00601 [Deltaproteobacteria bacterium ADurb.Bin002]|nr:MAG: hypothetical protein BWX45_00601 [Deltaproteobacteria bacterium ADurb.Bin002]
MDDKTTFGDLSIAASNKAKEPFPDDNKVDTRLARSPRNIGPRVEFAVLAVVVHLCAYHNRLVFDRSCLNRDVSVRVYNKGFSVEHWRELNFAP